MPAKSKSQQRLMGMVHAIQKGKLDPNKVSKKAQKLAKSMKKKDAKKFASTKHKNLPNKVKQENILRKYIKHIIQEELQLNEDLTNKDIKNIRNIIRDEIARIWKDLWIKRKTWT